MTRRQFFGRAGIGVGAAALGWMMARDGRAMPVGAPEPMTPRPPRFAAKAKAVIYLHMAGAPSQLELFDYKPALQKFDGKPCPDEFLKGKRFAFIKGVPNMLGTPFKFARHGQAGTEISELLPHFSGIVDEVAVIRSMMTDQFNHAPAQLFMQTGSPLFGGASMGSWATYGLGSVNQNLPGFVVLTSGGKVPDAGKSVWGSGFLPSVYQGVQCRTTGDPVLYVADPRGMDRAGRRDVLDTVRKLNEAEVAEIGDPETLTRIAQYELAYRMQISVPEVMDISKEPRHVLDLYGARSPAMFPMSREPMIPRPISKGDDPAFANNCLLARRLVEQGVRFVQLYDWGWDHHGVSPGEDIEHQLPIKCQQIDRAVSGLIADLKQRGMLDSTLVVWGGEFGRTPMRQNAGAKFIGRDHHPYAFSMWMAGGGIKGGVNHGQTDELGYYITQDRMTVRDLQATILHLLGVDAWRLIYPYQGLEQRLIGVEGKAEVRQAILA